jgi:hypothetical protein
MTAYARSRSRTIRDVPNILYRTYSYTSPGTSLIQTNKEDEAISDYVTPNYQEVINSGGIVNWPCTYEHSATVEDDAGVYHQVQNSTSAWAHFTGPLTGYWLNSTYFAHPPEPSSGKDVEELITRAKLVALSNMDRSPYAFGEDLGEIGETIRFLRNPLSSLASLGKKFRKSYQTRLKKTDYRGLRKSQRYLGGRAPSTKQILDAHASTWLEYRFAASPLVRSAWDAVQAFVHTRKTYPKRVVARGFSAYEDNVSSNYTSVKSANDKATWDVNVSRSQKVHAVIIYEWDNPIKDTYWALGLTPKDIPYTIWQLLPFSFMVDRVTDISSMIRAGMNLGDSELKVLAGNFTVRDEKVKKTRFLSRTTTGYTIQVSPSTVEETTYTQTRTPWNPSVRDLQPGFTPGRLIGDLTSTADLVSLILQRFRI